MIEIRYFIKKDFLGWPTGIIVGKYENDKKVGGDFHAPKSLNKYKGFGCLDEIRNYKICTCGKCECKANEALYKIVDDFYNPMDFVS